MKRREVVALLVGGFVEWPLPTHAQQPPAMPTVGFLSGRSSSEAAYAVAAFRQGLGESGHVEGNNVNIEYRWRMANMIVCQHSQPNWLVVA